MNRREFLQVGAAGLALSALGQYAVTAAVDQKPMRVGVIGCGWYGKSDCFRLIQVSPVEVVSMCDTDKRMLDEAADMVSQRQVSKKKPRMYGDYREMLKEKDLDIVIVGTPDHWHALPAIAAVQAGAHVYVQKPICVDVVEGQAMVAAARKYNRVMQVGTQRRSTPHFIDFRDKYIKEGKLGKIGYVEIFGYYHMRPTENTPEIAPPDYLDYEMWTGPAPMRPFTAWTHPGRWRAFMEYGNGMLGDIGIHMFDATRWLLGLGWPKRILSSGGILVDKASRSNITDTQTVSYDFDNLSVVWQHRSWGEARDKKMPWGLTIYGDKGTIKADLMGYDFIPYGGGKAVHQEFLNEADQFPSDKTEKRIELNAAPATRRHMLDFLGAIAAGTKPVADIHEGHISTASIILGNISQQLGRSLIWDGAKEQVVNDDEANKLLRRDYRHPWIHPDPATV